MTHVKQTAQCLLNLEDAHGVPPCIRIGGTTQDRAVYDPKQTQPVSYTLPPGKQVPEKLSFGPRFIDLASQLKGPTTIGLNRRSGDQENVGLAALNAVQQMKNLYAIELGNEPEYWGRSSPEAQEKQWTPEADARSQIRWQKAISARVNAQRLFQAGVFLSRPRWSVKRLAPLEVGQSSIVYTKSFGGTTTLYVVVVGRCLAARLISSDIFVFPGGHAYPQSACGKAKTSLPMLMAHSNIVGFVKGFESEVRAANKAQRPYHFSETNSATCGGGGISATFGAALWLIDYVFQSLILGVHRLYFHQGTINHSPYNFWNETQVAPPYYGAYFTALALRGADYIGMMNTPDAKVAVYTLWKSQKLVRLVVYNSKFQDAHAIKESESSPDILTIDRLPAAVSGARLLRLTAKHSLVPAGGPQPGLVQIGGAFFDNNTCRISAPPTYQPVALKEGRLELKIHKSEAVIIELDSSKPIDSR
ncbi:hypothetical protein VP01_1631g5 [Puccinia sorghi]|uniref:Beta-glucuronidase C-terminal domain-containing protein n=1 Tax=Puccinia sorghi TaxID=27349 RepID=A0A0L6VGV7_9BASI|nr:hypothetical protein VP01_1631g5 [Puccinia sorghi]